MKNLVKSRVEDDEENGKRKHPCQDSVKGGSSSVG